MSRVRVCVFGVVSFSSGLSVCPTIFVSFAIVCCIKLSKRGGSNAINDILNVVLYGFGFSVEVVNEKQE